jgi:hypothetical protein
VHNLQIFVFGDLHSLLDGVENGHDEGHGLTRAIRSSDEHIKFLTVRVDSHLKDF